MIHICDCGCVIGVEIHELYVGSIVMDGRRKYEYIKCRPFIQCTSGR